MGRQVLRRDSHGPAVMTVGCKVPILHQYVVAHSRMTTNWIWGMIGLNESPGETRRASNLTRDIIHVLVRNMLDTLKELSSHAPAMVETLEPRCLLSVSIT